MSYAEEIHHAREPDLAPGDDDRTGTEIVTGIRGYLAGLGLSVLLTVASFWVTETALLWAPAIPVALVVLAIAQMGVHLVFLLHITTAPDSANNVLALAFGVLIVLLLIGGSLWIMWTMNQSMMSSTMLMRT